MLSSKPPFAARPRKSNAPLPPQFGVARAVPDGDRFPSELYASKKYPAPLPPTQPTSDTVDKRTSTPHRCPPTSPSRSVRFREEIEQNPLNVDDKTHFLPRDSPSHAKETQRDSKLNVIYDQPSLERRTIVNWLLQTDGYIRPRSDADKMEDKKLEVGNLKSSVRDKRLFSADEPKPVINDVRCVRQWAPKSVPQIRPKLRTCRSDESIDRMGLLQDLPVAADEAASPGQLSGPGRPARSSFVDPNGPPTRRSVYIELGEYQTLLKHSKNDEDRVYSLPQPQCYGDDTLKAVRLITEKYDTFKRRQLRALSFRDGVIKDHRSSNSIAKDQKIPEETMPLMDEAVGEHLHGDDGDRNLTNLKTVLEEPANKKDVAVDIPLLECDRLRLDLKPWNEVSADVARYATSTPDDDLSYDLDGGISRVGRARIELFYRSRDTSVYVCSSLADLFLGSASSDDGCHWIHTHTGVPVWVLNSGDGIRRREMTVVLAERETGFPLWQDKINYLSNYRELGPTVHILRISGSLSKMVRLNVFRQRSADEFLAKFRSLTADPHDDLWKISELDGRRRERKKKSKDKRRRRISKASISQPCNFVHISRVDLRDLNFRAAFAAILPMPTDDRGQLQTTNTRQINTLAEKEMSADRTDDVDTDVEFRPRLPTS